MIDEKAIDNLVAAVDRLIGLAPAHGRQALEMVLVMMMTQPELVPAFTAIFEADIALGNCSDDGGLFIAAALASRHAPGDTDTEIIQAMFKDDAEGRQVMDLIVASRARLGSLPKPPSRDPSLN